jgi:DNA-binding CsgD family transcriptional regulator
MNKYPFIFFFLYSFTLFANDNDFTPPYENKLIYQGEKGLIDFKIVDFNNDQISDIVIINYFLHSIDWLEGTPQGTYITHNVTTLFESPSKLLVEDFTGDGKKDIVVSGANGLYVFVQENIYNFKRRQISESTVDCWGMKAVDIDRDNDLDLVTISQKNNTLMWHKNSDGNFQNILISDTLTKVYSLDLIDANQDDNIDLIVSSKNMDNVIIYLNNEASFTPHTLCSNTFSGKSKAIDVNQDGYMDIVCTPTKQSNFHIHYNLGNFSFRTDTILLEKKHLVVDINSLDIDENGMVDLCLNDFKSNRTSLFLQNENHKFSHDTLYDYQNSHVTNLSVLDFDSDKDLDIVLCNVFDGTIVLLENRRHHVINYIEIFYRVYKSISNNLFFVLILLIFIIGFLFYKQNKISHYFTLNNKLISSLQQKVNHQELINYRQGQAIQEIQNSNHSIIPTKGNLDHFLSELKELNPKINDIAVEYKLSKTEYRLLVFIKSGLNNYDLAELLSVSTNTIYVQRQRLKTKLKLESTKALNDFIKNL